MIEPVDTSEEIRAVASLATEIWREHFTPIIGAAQVDYMLAKLQSAPAIAHQIGELGYEYYLLVEEGEPIGYFALVPHRREGTMQLSKLYLRRADRGRGHGKAMLAFTEERCHALELGELWLTVNKHNRSAIDFYRRAGFCIEESIVTDIGSGFVMDDYRMRKSPMSE